MSTIRHWQHREVEKALAEGVPADRISSYCVEETGKQLSKPAGEAMAKHEATRGGDDKRAEARARLWAELHLYDHFARWRSTARVELEPANS